MPKCSRAPHGYQIVNIADGDAEFTYARRMADGDVVVCNRMKDYQAYLEEQEEDDLEEP